MQLFTALSTIFERKLPWGEEQQIYTATSINNDPRLVEVDY